MNKIILDTDPGGDDIFALLWLQSLVKQGKAELIAVTTAEGNVDAKQTFINASKVLSLGGFEQVELGRGVTLKNSKIADAAYIHGMDGMGNISDDLPSAKHHFDSAIYSDDLIIDKLNAYPGEITILAVAPLTNLAAAESKSPGILKKAKEIVIMGGAFKVPGNVTPYAEFNIIYNSQAAEKVFASRNDIVVLPLDITHELIFTPEMAEDIIRNSQNYLTKFLSRLCDFMTTASLRYRQTKGIKGFLVHDGAVVAYLFYPETLLFRRALVEIETQGYHTQGATLFDERFNAKTHANAWVALQVDKVGLLASLLEDLSFLGNW
ncbi:MAG: nucleoside hydrolase [Richelia sp. RM2_1_2]|nr:nucleoside hydrolase [Richelia sp. SM1_7_0]NJN10866.1 nucleoside hydrolase [Richelia sp. RM1_1_1]NJO30199.1 nucleoside hydrolase [Richelia sp. SL_2_1]NJO58041.1 nucleoside hydrolase [Richelia sp. RM2_1_2]NJS15941.1 nucleoside hydrolase [Nostocaceae cyanobacterium CSU_2_110]